MAGHRIFATSFASIYPLYVTKVERKDRDKAEVDQVICWLTGYDAEGLAETIASEVDLQTFFAEAPRLNPNVALIKGVVCGVRVEEIEDPAHAEDPLHGQAGRRAGEGKEARVHPARWR